MNATCKTPVSILQELCMGRNITPIYSIIDDESPAHLKTFICTVSCDELTAEGHGRSKKKAKHAAAENMLKQIVENPSIPSPYEGELSEDAIGPLTDFCVEYGIKLPQYTHTRAEGPSHATIFTCKCTVGNFATEAIQRVKQQSKQQAASLMLHKCKNMVDSRLKIRPSGDKTIVILAKVDNVCFTGISFNTPAQEEDFKKAKSSLTDVDYNEIKQFHVNDLTCNLTTDFLRFNEIFPTDSDGFTELMNWSLNEDIKGAMKTLKSILEKSEINYTLLPIESADSETCIVILIIDIAPNLCVHESGKNYMDACQNVAVKALQFLRILCAPRSKPDEISDNADFEMLINSKQKAVPT